MAKRISTDAKIVLERAGFEVERTPNKLLVSGNGQSEILPIIGGCIENDLIENILQRAIDRRR